jgi:hypothetical protein
MPEIVRFGLLDDPTLAFDRLNARIREGIDAMRRANEARSGAAYSVRDTATQRRQW